MTKAKAVSEQFGHTGTARTVVYFDQQTYACACIWKFKNDKKCLKIVKNICLCRALHVPLIPMMKSVFFTIFMWFLLFLIMGMHSKACIPWLIYTTKNHSRQSSFHRLHGGNFGLSDTDIVFLAILCLLFVTIVVFLLGLEIHLIKNCYCHSYRDFKTAYINRGWVLLEVEEDIVRDINEQMKEIERFDNLAFLLKVNTTSYRQTGLLVIEFNFDWLSKVYFSDGTKSRFSLKIGRLEIGSFNC